MCEFCGEGPECAVCGRGRPATVARPEPQGGDVDQLLAAADRLRHRWESDGLPRETILQRFRELLFGSPFLNAEPGG
jgi:hypothetical protein